MDADTLQEALATAAAGDAQALAGEPLLEVVRQLAAASAVIGVRLGPSVAATMLRAIAHDFDQLRKG